MSQMPLSYLWLIPLLPFAGFLINGTLGRKLPRAAVTAVALFFTAIPAALVPQVNDQVLRLVLVDFFHGR